MGSRNARPPIDLPGATIGTLGLTDGFTIAAVNYDNLACGIVTVDEEPDAPLLSRA